MLLWLAQNFQQDLGFLRVFNFITFRAVFATLPALAIGLIAGPAVIRMLARLKVGQAVRTDGPQTHLIKTGTPTMGGVLILIGIGIATLLWADLTNRFIWIVLIVTLGFGAIGWGEDFRHGGLQEPERYALTGKIFLAIADRHRRRFVSGILGIGADQYQGVGIIPGLGPV